MFKRIALISLMLLAVMVSGCQTAEPETVEVTRIVTLTEQVEVEVPVEVTRVVEVPVEQAALEAPSINPMIPIEFERLISSATGREYAITIVLPLSYMMTDINYPVLYVTDGNSYAIPLGMAASQLGFGQEIPEVITVGVDYVTPNPMEWLELRELDMGLEGSEKYLQFFAEELIPLIESTYRVDSGMRTLVGHSSGANFSMYALLHGTDTFDNFIASSPSTGTVLADELDDFLADKGDKTVKLFCSAGELDTEEVLSGMATFDAALAELDTTGLDSEMMVLDNETHLSARPRAFSNGLRWLFASAGE